VLLYRISYGKSVEQMGCVADGAEPRPKSTYASYSGMTDSDLDAIVAYLRTVPPLE
jgi:hypothetical protein